MRKYLYQSAGEILDGKLCFQCLGLFSVFQSWRQLYMRFIMSTQDYIRPIKMLGVHSNRTPALGVLDSATYHGIWISDRLIKKLGLQGEISHHLPPLTPRQGGNHLLTSCGSILLHWQWMAGMRLHCDDLFNGSIKIVLALDFEHSDKSQMGTTSIWRPRVMPVPQDGAEGIVEMDEVRKDEESARRNYRCCTTTHQQFQALSRNPKCSGVPVVCALQRFQSQAAP